MNTSFGEELRAERKKQGKTVQSVADACGTSRSYITLIETGRRLPAKKNLLKIARALDLKPAVVLNWYLVEISQKIRSSLDIS